MTHERCKDAVNECNFDQNLTKLYSSIQNKKWDDALEQLASSPHEANIWVYKERYSGEIQWRLLPLHAAIIFKAPEKLIESLLIQNPQGAQCKDDQGALPIHLAIRNKCSEVTVTLLLMAYPNGVEVEDRKNRRPLTLANSTPINSLKTAYITALKNVHSYIKITQAAATSPTFPNHAEEERVSLTERIEDLETELARTKEHGAVVDNHVNQLEVQATLASTALQSAERKGLSLTKTIEDLETELTRAKEHGATVDDKVNQLEVKAALASANAQSVERKAEAERLKFTESIEDLEKELARSKEHGATFDNHVKQLEMQAAQAYAAMQSAERKAEAEILTLNEKIEDLKREIARAKEHATTFDNHVKQLEVQAVQASAAMQSTERKASAERLSFTEKIEDLERELARAKEQRTTIDNNVNQLEVQAALASATAQSTERKANAERLSLTEKIEDLEKELAHAQEHRTVVDNQVNELEAKVRSHQNKERSLATKITTLDTKVNDMTIHNQRLQKKKTDVEDFTKTLVSEVAKLRNTLSKQETINTTQRDNKERMEEKVRYLEKDRDRVLAEIDAMETQLKMKIQTETKLREVIKNAEANGNTKFCTYLPFS